MTTITVDNGALNASSQMLDKLREAQRVDEIKNPEIQSMQRTLADEFGRMKDCEDNIGTAHEQIAALEKALAGWQAYRTYQERRLPGLRRRYTAARDYIRAAEDEQTGNI